MRKSFSKIEVELGLQASHWRRHIGRHFFNKVNSIIKMVVGHLCLLRILTSSELDTNVLLN